MTDTLQIDLTRIPHLEKRRRIAALWEDHERIDDESSAAAKPFWDKRRALDNAMEAKVAAIRAAHKAEYETIDDEMRAAEKPFEEQCGALYEQVETFAAAGGGVRWWDDYSGIERCALSGLPLLGHDDLWENEAGEKILAALIERDDAAATVQSEKEPAE